MRALGGGKTGGTRAVRWSDRKNGKGKPQHAGGNCGIYHQQPDGADSGRYLPQKTGYGGDFLLYLEHCLCAGSGAGHSQGAARYGYLAGRPGGFL